LINGTQAKNVVWKIEGAVGINNYSVFCGTIVCNNGAMGALNTGVTLNGRALTTGGALTTTAVSTTMAAVCVPAGIEMYGMENSSVSIFPNPFTASFNIVLKEWQLSNYQFKMYNVLGAEMMTKQITNQSTTIETTDLTPGIYFYRIVHNNTVIASGKLVAQQ
jgi:hypothetical protein